MSDCQVFGAGRVGFVLPSERSWVWFGFVPGWWCWKHWGCGFVSAVSIGREAGRSVKNVTVGGRWLRFANRVMRVRFLALRRVAAARGSFELGHRLSPGRATRGVRHARSQFPGERKGLCKIDGWTNDGKLLKGSWLLTGRFIFSARDLLSRQAAYRKNCAGPSWDGLCEKS